MSNSGKTFAGKVAIVTGGSSGIGLALARALARAGAHVYIASRTDEKLAAAVAALAQQGLKVEARRLDVRDRSEFRRLASEVISLRGGIDFLFNVAGISVFGEARDHTDEDWDDVIDIDLGGVVNGVCAVYPHMIQRRAGHIVNVASLAGLLPTPAGIAYTAAKSAVVGLSAVLRLEASLHQVRVTAVCPAAVETPMVQDARCRRLDRASFIAAVPGHVADPDWCAAAILRGVARNRGLVVPGVAGVLARLHRFAPWLTQLILRRFVRQVARIRKRSEQPTP